MKVVDISVPVPWGVISGRTYGEETNTPVLCLHGRSDNLETFSYLLPLLPQNFFYVCIDLPGHGRSSHADVGYILDLPWYVLSVKRVIDHFKWSKIHLLGHSFGGQISFLIAALYPELVLKLIIIDALTVSANPIRSVASVLRNSLMESTLKLEKRLNSDEAPTYSLEEFLKKMKEGRLTELTTDQLRKMGERNLKKVGDDQFKYSNDQRTKILGLQSQFTVETGLLENIARDIRCPTLLIYGKESIVTKPLSKSRHVPLKLIKSLEIRYIDGDHDIQLNRPYQVSRLIVPFLTKETKSKL